MKFYTLENAPIYRDDDVFKQSPFNAAIPMVLFWAVAVVAILSALKIIAVAGPHFPPFIGYIFGGVFGLFGLIPFAQFHSSLKSTNWLLRANQSGVLIKYRSYLNRKLPASDVQVVAIDHSEIVWARNAVEKRTSFSTANGGRSRQSCTIKFLDLCIAGDTSALVENLSAENARESRATSHWDDYPVQLLDGGILRIRWSGISPGLDLLLKRLGASVEIKPIDVSSTDYTIANIGTNELKDKVLTLAGNGDKMAAIELVQKTLRCSTTEAVKFIEKITAQNS